MDETIKVQVRIPQSVAVREGRTRHGDATVAPTDEQWSALPFEQRAWLLKRGALEKDPLWGARVELTSCSLDWPTVAARIGELFAEDERQRAQAVAERETKIAELLQRTDEEWLTKDWCARVGRNVGAYLWYFHRPLNEDIASDQRIQAVGERLEPEIERRNAIVREQTIAREAEADAAAERSKAAKEAREKEAREDFRAWATGRGGALARAATDGYDVADGVVTDVLTQITSIDSRAVAIREGTKAWKDFDWEERTSPSEVAFTRYDEVKQHLATVDKPRTMEIELERVARFEPGRGAEPYTAVLVWVRSPITAERVVVFSAEAN
jgi:hypothetical protein